MNVFISNFIEFFNGVIKNASQEYKFYKHTNNRQKLREVYYPGTKNLPNIRVLLKHMIFYILCVENH